MVLASFVGILEKNKGIKGKELPACFGFHCPSLTPSEEAISPPRVSLHFFVGMMFPSYPGSCPWGHCLYSKCLPIIGDKKDLLIWLTPELEMHASGVSFNRWGNGGSGSWRWVHVWTSPEAGSSNSPIQCSLPKHAGEGCPGHGESPTATTGPQFATTLTSLI